MRQGGHGVDDEIVFRRYYAGLRNFLKHYLPLSDYAHIFDNSSETSAKRLIAEKKLGGSINILDMNIWEKIERDAYER